MYSNVEDSLLLHHAIYAHLPHKLSQVVSEYCDSGAWKLVYRGGIQGEKGLAPQSLSAEDLTAYNAADCRLTKLAFDRMSLDGARERTVYEHDKKLAEVCRHMQWEGIGVDLARKEALSRELKDRRDSLREAMSSLLGEPDFDPGKLDNVRRALFKSLGGRYLRLTPGGLPSTNNATLEALQGNDTALAKFSKLLLTWRVVGKIRSTYVEAIEINPKTGRTHYGWKPFGTVSGRLACRLQSCPRYDKRQPEGRTRELYVPRAGNVFVYFDVSQAEMRLAAYLSADPNFMSICGGDVHAGNAAMAFPEIAAKGWLTEKEAKADPKRGKPYRDIAKNLGFAILYRAESDKVFTTLRAKGFNISFQAVEVILAKLHHAYRRYYQFCDRNLAEVQKTGVMRSPFLGRLRILGNFPKPTDCANFPIQSALADIMNARMIGLIVEKRLPEKARVVANIHDALIIDTPKELADGVKDVIRKQWAEPISTAGGDLVLPIDLKTGASWAELG